MIIDKEDYKQSLLDLQIELVKLQRHLIKHDYKILVIFEGRDASGKDGVIKRITEHLSPRETRVVAMGKPSEREARAWHFQRYAAQLPVAAEMVLFNRSWYNRAGVEKVMGFCTPAECETFLETVDDFEKILIKSGIILLKYYLDISKEEQKERLQERKESPLTHWKVSPIDETAISKWDEYSQARDDMLERTHSKLSPWFIVKANHKKTARLNIIMDLLSRIKYSDSNDALCQSDPKIVSPYRKGFLYK